MAATLKFQGSAAPLLPVSLDGITPLPTGFVAAIKTYLAFPRGNFTGDRNGARTTLPPGIRCERLQGRDAPRYRALFQVLGERWLWWSRLMIPMEQLGVLLDDPAIEAYALTENGQDIGLLEWDLRDAHEPELAFLGLTDQGIGRSLGRALIDLTLARMFDGPAQSVRVNTCSFDHPKALAFYQQCGFMVVSQAIEIVPDPRLAGLLSLDAAPHIPRLSQPEPMGDSGRAG